MGLLGDGCSLRCPPAAGCGRAWVPIPRHWPGAGTGCMWWIRRRCTWNRHAKLDDPVFWPIVNHDNPDPAGRPESSSLPTSTFSGANTPSAANECASESPLIGAMAASLAKSVSSRALMPCLEGRRPGR